MDLDDKLNMMVKFCRENGLIGLAIDGVELTFHPDSIEPGGKNYADPVEAAQKLREQRNHAPLPELKRVHKFKRMNKDGK